MKKRGLLITIAFILLLAGVNIFLFSNKTGPSYTTISGMFLKEVAEFPLGLNFSTIAFIIQWVVLLAILVFAFSKYLKHKQTDNIQINYKIVNKQKTRAETDLDTFYNILKDKKKLTIGAISKVFKINKEKALEWAKILENHELVTIEYPAFSAPEIRLASKKDEKEKTQKEKGDKEKPKQGNKEKRQDEKPKEEKQEFKQKSEKPKEKFKPKQEDKTEQPRQRFKQEFKREPKPKKVVPEEQEPKKKLKPHIPRNYYIGDIR